MSDETVFVKGSEMGRKISMIIISASITLFFLAVGIYQLGKAFGNLGAGISVAPLMAGLISMVLFLLGIWCIVLIFKSDASHL
jgi:membrane-bound ClpP family serine protease